MLLRAVAWRGLWALLCATLAPPAVAFNRCLDGQLSLGGFHGLLLSNEPICIGFGENNAGQADVPASLASLITSVAAGGFHSCAMHPDLANPNRTTVSCWGTGTAAVIPDAIAAANVSVVAVAAGGYHSCAVLRSTQTLACWGSGAAAQVPANLRTTTVRSVALGTYHSCALTIDGMVACWGRDAEGQASTVPSFLTASGGGASTMWLSCGGYHCCAWGKKTLAVPFVACWGGSAAGQTTVPPEVSQQAAAGQLASMCAGGYHSCALVNGTVSCWGGAVKGGVANVPPEAADGSVTAVACSWYGACVLRGVSVTPRVVCWGGAPAAPLASDPPTAPRLVLATGAVVADVVMPSFPFARSGSILIASGSGVGEGARSGALSVVSGPVVSGVSGSLTMTTGPPRFNASGALWVETGPALGSGASSGPIVLTVGTPSGGKPAGSISLQAPLVYVEGRLATGSLRLGGNSSEPALAVGNVTLSGAQLAALLALLPQAPSPTT